MTPAAMLARIWATVVTSLKRPSEARAIHSMWPAIAMAVGRASVAVIRGPKGRVKGGFSISCR